MSGAVFLTGATGFLGGALAAELARRGEMVHALVRAPERAAPLAQAGATLHAGDLRDPVSVARALGACCAHAARPRVIHCGALISYRTGDRAEQLAINVEGTRGLLEACRRLPIGRVLHVSSVVAVGHAPALAAPLDEDAPFNGAGLRVDYVDTKRAAEELALAAARELDVVVVNPGAIFGPGSSGANTLRFLNLVATGRMGPLAPPGSIAPVGVEDVVAGCLLALERGARGRRYILSESSVAVLDAFRLAATIFDTRPPRGRVPRLVWSALAAGARVVDSVRRLQVVTPQSMRMLARHFVYDAARARRELGWAPEPFPSVLRRTVAWAKTQGLVP